MSREEVRCAHCWQRTKPGDTLTTSEDGLLCKRHAASQAAPGYTYVALSEYVVSDPRLPRSRFSFNVTIQGA